MHCNALQWWYIAWKCLQKNTIQRPSKNNCLEWLLLIGIFNWRWLKEVGGGLEFGKEGKGGWLGGCWGVGGRQTTRVAVVALAEGWAGNPNWDVPPHALVASYGKLRKMEIMRTIWYTDNDDDHLNCAFLTEDFPWRQSSQSPQRVDVWGVTNPLDDKINHTVPRGVMEHVCTF